jgi:tRNA nucleotidyltransferase (CCA-adding enzyme)
MDNIFSAIKNEGGSALIVGGFVRDTLLGLTPKDRDVEVYGLTPDRLLHILSSFGEVDSVGKSFGILKLNYQGEILDFSLPRRENKCGAGHKGFDVSVDPFMSVKEAASRRDLTINSLAMTPNGDIIDYFGGVRDLQAKILRHTSPAFSEDSLRVLRVMQFASRFGFSVAPETLSLCSQLSPADLPAERIAEEFRKWALGVKPSLGLDFLNECGWIKHWAVLADLIGCEQEPAWHPEGDAWLHSGLVCNSAADISRREALSKEDTFLLVMSALLHDVGKPATTFVKNGRIVSPGHDVVGEGLSRQFCELLKFSQSNTDVISSLVRTHMYHCGGISARKARRLVHKFKIPYNLLWLLIEADHSGRPPLPKGLPVKAVELKELVEVELRRAKGPLVLGRHLIERGYEAGPSLGIKLKELYHLQVEEGLDFNQLMERV